VRILVASPIFPDTLKKLREEHDVVEAFNAPEDELKSHIADREVLVFRSGVNITGDVMACAPNLRLLIRAGSGLDNLDMTYVQEHDLKLVRVPGPGARAVAELAFAFMLALARQVPLADRLTRQGRWAKHEIRGYLLADKTLGIYGAGNIGTQVGQMGAAWGMHVIGSVEHPSPARAASLGEQGIRLADSRELLTTSDFLSLHVPLQDSTRNLIDAGAIAQMKRGAFLINLARGGVVDEEALHDALKEGHLGGAGMDVHNDEGEGRISPLADLANVVLTPHMGAGTVDSQRRIGERILEIIATHRLEEPADSGGRKA